MTDRIIELARHLAQAAGTPEAQELLDLIGEDGDPHPRAGRHPSSRHDEAVPKDTTRFTKITHQVDPDTVKFPHDINYKVGVGYYVTSLHLGSMNHEHDNKHRKNDKQAGVPKLSYQSSVYFLSEGLILSLADEIKTATGMQHATQLYINRTQELVEKAHPGTDALDSAKSSLHHDSSDAHGVDQSESTIHISNVSSTGTFLNGSATKHSNYVSLEINGPDGRQICEIGLSMEQFAAALTTRQNIPCTLHSYWSMGPEAVRLTERVREPPSIMNRMRARIDGRIDEKHKWLREIQEKLEKAAKDGKPMGKTALADIAKTMGIAMSHIKENSSFAAEQAVEEISGIVESAIIHLGQKHGVGLDRIAATPEIMHSIKDVIALPAPKATP